MMRRRSGWLWLGAALLAGCFSPSYESGKTRCSPARECPSGFQCAFGVCYREGEVPVEKICAFDQDTFDDGCIFGR